MTNNDDLALKLKAAAEKATPGPWYVHDKPCEDGNYGIDTSDKEFLAEAVVWWGFSRQSIWREEDAKYIAAANPAAILVLLAERDWQAKRIEMLEKYVNERDEENQGLLLTVGRLHTKLEARTVSIKLPPVTDAQDWLISVDVYEADKVHQALAAAGINLEVDE